MNIQVAVLALCFNVVFAPRAPVNPYRRKPPGCTVDGKTFAVGEQYDIPGRCDLNKCLGNDTWAAAPCGIVGGLQGWVYIPESTSKPYPQCCGHVVPPLDIVPDVLDEVPGIGSLDIQYGGAKVEQGNELTPTQVKNQPSVSYDAEPKGWYLICMTDPDAPSRHNATKREVKHWLVGNIPGTDVSAGEVLAEYVGSGPPKDTGLHRYVFLLYKQPQKLSFDEPKISKTSREGRAKFSIRKFAQKYNLGNPVAVNVFQAKYDDYVLELHKQLGLDKNT